MNYIASFIFIIIVSAQNFLVIFSSRCITDIAEQIVQATCSTSNDIITRFTVNCSGVFTINKIQARQIDFVVAVTRENDNIEFSITANFDNITILAGIDVQSLALRDLSLTTA